MEPVESRLSFDLERRIDALCDGFEARWAAGEAPRIEDYLRPFPAPLRGDLLRALLPVEIELRARDGAPPTREECHRRFPDYAREVADVFAPPPDRPTGPGPVPG
jgi:hypothetical protein